MTVFGVPLPLLFDGGMFASMLVLIAGGVTVFIKGIPDRKRADNEGRQMIADEHTLIRTDYVKQITDLRVAVHDLRNELYLVTIAQSKTDKLLAEATATNRHSKGQMHTMLFLIRLLISELKRTDPESIIVAQAELTLAQMTKADDPAKSSALNVAEHAVADAKQTVISTEKAVLEIGADEAKVK